MVLHGSDEGRKAISFRNKSRVSLHSYFESLLDCQQVNQSLSKVPSEYIVLHNLKEDEDPIMSVTEAYFSMPLYQLLNEEMINFDSQELPKDDLPFLCERYSDEQVFVEDDSPPKERKQVWFDHLLRLRETN